MRRASSQARVRSRLERLVRAYPPSWRAERGSELCDTVTELLGPGTSGLGPRLVLDLLIGGWATRLREHPPVLVWLRYRLLDLTPPPRWRVWLAQDIAGRFFPARRGAQWLLFTGLPVGWSAAQGHWTVSPLAVLVWLSIWVLMTVILRARVRRQAYARHGFDSAGRWLPVAAPRPVRVITDSPDPERQVWPWLVIGGVLALVLAVPWLLILIRLAPTFTLPAATPAASPTLPGYPHLLLDATVGCLAAAAGLTLLVARRLPRRLAGRMGAPAGPAVNVDRRRLIGWVAGSGAGWAVLGLLRAASPVAEPYSLGLLGVVLLTAPPALAAGLIARRLENRMGRVVTAREVLLGTLGRAAAIPVRPPKLIIATSASPVAPASGTTPGEDLRRAHDEAAPRHPRT
jgi:hypothetical protein